MNLHQCRQVEIDLFRLFSFDSSHLAMIKCFSVVLNEVLGLIGLISLWNATSKKVEQQNKLPNISSTSHGEHVCTFARNICLSVRRTQFLANRCLERWDTNLKKNIRDTQALVNKLFDLFSKRQLHDLFCLSWADKP